MHRLRVIATALICLVWVISGTQDAGAAPPPPEGFAFDETYDRLDLPVEEEKVTRTWMWGSVIEGGEEVYEEADSGWRDVRYYDKARMEYDPESDDPLWSVTNGLLVVELITGKMQVGDDSFISHEPAEVPVVGDYENSGSPTYAALQPLLDAEPGDAGDPITATLDSDGNVGEDTGFERYSVTSVDVGSATNHTIASVFWEFMTSSGMIWVDRVDEDDELRDQYEEDRLFPNPFYATGYPITAAYWTQSEVGGEVKDVLLQCFERRCLTYTPDNPEGWEVESGNVGFHYYTWRHHDLEYGFAEHGRAFKVGTGSFLFRGYWLNNTVGTEDDYFHVGLRGISTLGPGECLAEEAWEFVIESLDEQYVAFEGTNTGNWDRREPYRIWLGHGMEGLFNEELVRRGYATVDWDKPDPLFHEQLVDAQEQAREEVAGIWGECQ